MEGGKEERKEGMLIRSQKLINPKINKLSTGKQMILLRFKFDGLKTRRVDRITTTPAVVSQKPCFC